MKSMGFNSIAPIYDILARLVFGKSLAKAQTFYLDRIPPSSHVLVVGGGTGWWLRKFLQTHPTCRICFVDESSEMIRIAKKVTHEDHRIEFRQTTHDSISELNKFDAVITFCFLDIFSVPELKEVVKKLNDSMKPHGVWLVTDFVETKWWQSTLLFIMYRFFRLTTGLKNQSLPDWHKVLLHFQLVAVERNLFWGGFISSSIYTKLSV